MVVLGDFLVPLSKVGTPKFRQWVVDRLPLKLARDFQRLIDTLYSNATEIVNNKKKALELGDEAVSQQLGQGKDILSRLRMCNSHLRSTCP